MGREICMQFDDLIKHQFIARRGDTYQLNPNIRFSIKRNPSTWDEVINHTSFLNDYDPTPAERIYSIVNNITARPLCPSCGNPIPFRLGYNETCGYKCRHKYEQTAIDPSTGKSLKQLRRDKVRESNYIVGEDGLSGYQRGIKKTHEYLNSTIDETTGKTLAELRVDKIYQTKTATIEENGNSVLENSIVKYKETRRRSFIEKQWKKILERYNSITTVENFIEHGTSEWECKGCNTKLIFNFSRSHNAGPRCLECYPLASSLFEAEISDYVKSLGIEVILRTRNIIAPLEFDIYIPTLNFAIEANGIYWHSTACVDDDYHQIKTQRCADAGVQLIHIFEDEWMYKQEIVKSIIRHKLGLQSEKLNARDGEVREMSAKECRAFLEENHIQGADNAKYRLGLYIKDELVSVMTFGVSRFSKKYEWEILRFCNRLNLSVRGAASKLYARFLKEKSPNTVVSYADLRLGTGKTYLKLGFKLDHNSSPNYWYLRDTEKLSRYACQKHRLPGVLGEEFDANKTEVENMIDAGYFQMFDSGNAVYAWRRNGE